jgi:hypothetical protein
MQPNSESIRRARDQIADYLANAGIDMNTDNSIHCLILENGVNLHIEECGHGILYSAVGHDPIHETKILSLFESASPEKNRESLPYRCSMSEDRQPIVSTLIPYPLTDQLSLKQAEYTTIQLVASLS